MKVTKQQLKDIIRDSMLDIEDEDISLPMVVSVEGGNSTFYWVARDAKEVQPGFVVPVSGPISPRGELEDIYEAVRLEINPTAPSRFNCVYVCPSLNGFCRKPSDRSSLGHKGDVYKVNVTGKVFFADAEMWTEGHFRLDRGDSGGAIDYAISYWEGADQKEARSPSEYSLHEALVEGTVTVIEKVNF